MTVFKQVSSPHLLLVSKTDSPAHKHKRLVEPMLLCNVLIVPHFNVKSNKTETSVKSPEIWKSNKSFIFVLLTFSPIFVWSYFYHPTVLNSHPSWAIKPFFFFSDNPQIKQRGWWVRQAGQVENLQLCPNPLSCERDQIPGFGEGLSRPCVGGAVSSELHAVHFPLWGSVAYKSGY